MNSYSIGPNDAELFDKYVSKNPAIVKFYHPGCYHCNKMAPAWKELERKVNSNGANILIIEVHADAIKDINSECARHVRGYPTIMSVKEGGLPGQEHNGPRDTETMMRFMKSTIPRASRRKRVGLRRHRSRRKRNTNNRYINNKTNHRRKNTRRKLIKKR